MFQNTTTHCEFVYIHAVAKLRHECYEYSNLKTDAMLQMNWILNYTIIIKCCTIVLTMKKKSLLTNVCKLVGNRIILTNIYAVCVVKYSFYIMLSSLPTIRTLYKKISA